MNRKNQIQVNLVRDIYRNGEQTPCKIRVINGAAKIEIPQRGQADKVLRAGDKVSDDESDLVCRIYDATVTIPATHPL